MNSVFLFIYFNLRCGKRQCRIRFLSASSSRTGTFLHSLLHIPRESAHQKKQVPPRCASLWLENLPEIQASTIAEKGL